MIITNNSRSKCYLQNLLKIGQPPQLLIYMNSGSQRLVEHTFNDLHYQEGHSQTLIKHCPITNISYDDKLHILDSAVEHCIPVVEIFQVNVNHPDIVQSVHSAPGEFILFSGPGGNLLRSEILNSGKKILHIHPGLLPSFRGSTPFYYSALIEKKLQSTAFWMTEEVDQGYILEDISLPITSSIRHMDHLHDPAIRTLVLVNLFQKEIWEEKEPSSENDNTFFIIHPILKHITILNFEQSE